MVYALASGFDLDSTIFRQGWARRSLVHGELYGEKNMTHDFVRQIWAMVMKGEENKSDKMSPRQMYLELRETSGRYTSPSEQEIRSKVSEILKEIKSGRTFADYTDENGNRKKGGMKAQSYGPKLDLAIEKITLAMKLKLRQKGWADMSPKDVVYRIVMEKKVGGALSLNEYEKIRQKLASKFSALKSAKKKKRNDMRLRAVV